MRKILSLFTMLLLVSTLAVAQTRPITGRVIDEAGQPVSGASVVVRGSSTGASADADGNFRISAKTGDVLVVTAVGIPSKEVKVPGGSTLSISLSRQSQQLSEVVVTTALGLRRTRSSVPYATQQVSGEEITKTLNTNFVDNLSGKVSGLQITSSNTMGGSSNVILRGMKSLTQSNQALFVVDGVPYDNSNQSFGSANRGYDLGNAASDINPEDIESISVLKGAAASALYGSRASNGVILITTKKGARKKGLGVTVNFGVTAGTPDKSTLPTYQTEYGQGYGPFFYNRTIFNSNGQKVNVVQAEQDAAVGPRYDPSLMVYNWDAFTPGNPNYGKATPWAPAAHHDPTDYFVTPVTTSTNVFVNGGTDKGTFKMGFTTSDDKGYLPNSDLKKNLLNLNATYNIINNLTVGTEFNYSDVKAIGRYGYGYTGTSINPMADFRQWWPTNIDIQQLKADYFNTHTNATWNWTTAAYASGNNPTIGKPAYHDNWYWERYTNYQNDSRPRYFGNINANYKINSFLNIMGRISRDAYTEMIETRYDVGSQGTPSYNRYNSQYAETNYDALINFDKNVVKNLNVKALLGTNIRKLQFQSINMATNGGIVVPGFFALANSVNTPTAPTEVLQNKEVDGVFAGATIGYNEMVTIDATVRRDRSSTLPEANNTYYYPSVSGNFVFSKLLTSSTWLSFGKLRVNYAQVGGDAPIYSLQNTYTAGTAFNSQTIFASPATNNNPILIPETNKTYEAGIEASFLKNRIGFDVTYYKARQLNQITPITVSRASGYSTFFVNGGEVENKGVEVTLNATPVKTRNISWNATINFTKNKNNVVSLYNGQPSYNITSWQNSIYLVAEIGKPWGVLRGTDYQYVNGQRLVDASGYYVLNPNAQSDIGNINPNWTAGINNSLTYKNISLSFLIDVRKGGDVYSLDMDYGSSSGLYPETAGLNDLGKPVRDPLSSGGGIILPGVDASGKANTVRVDASDINAGNYVFSSSYGMADKSYVYDASYVKLREIALRYTIPAKVVDKLKFVRSIDVSLTGRNLWIIHKNLPYADPEQGVASGNGSMGFQSGAYPTFRTFGFNVRVNF